MKSKAVIFALFLIFLSHTGLGQDSHEWYPYSIANDPDAVNDTSLAPFILDAPAGKHGFVKTKGKKFVFDDGKTIKFWGANLCFEACFPSKNDAKMLAKRLAFFGFNAVRLHHLDYASEPKGIFSNQINRSTLSLSPTQLDRLDYLIYELKMNGIYVDLNLLVSRRFSDSDGVKDAAKLKMAAKPVSFFNPKLIQLQKKYAEQLLTHFNPYTQLRMSEDPAIALVEIVNESSLFDAWKWNQLNPNAWGLKKGMIPDIYLNELDKRWRGWLRQKYGEPPKNLKRVSFRSRTQQEDTNEFYRYIESVYFRRMLNFLKKDLHVQCAITGIGGYSQPEDLRAEAAADFSDKHVYWDHPVFPKRPWDKNNFQLADTSSLKDHSLGMIGSLDELAGLDKPVTVTEWNHCYPNRYAYESPVLMAAYGALNGWDALFYFTYADGWEMASKFDEIIGYFDLIANPQQLILCSVASYIYHQSEPMHIKTDTDKGQAIFQNSSAIGLSGFIKNEVHDLGFAEIRADQNGSVFLYAKDSEKLDNSNKMILVALSEVKNTGSAWVSGRYHWGTAPVLLKKISVQIRLKSSNKFRMYVLDNKGMRAEEIPAKYMDGSVSFDTRRVNCPWFEIATE